MSNAQLSHSSFRFGRDRRECSQEAGTKYEQVERQPDAGANGGGLRLEYPDMATHRERRAESQNNDGGSNPKGVGLHLG